MSASLPAPAFHPDDAGTPEPAWLARLAQTPTEQLDLSRFRRLVVLAAHPDDETLMCGGLIAAAAERSLSVDVLIASDGEASHPNSPTHTAADLATVRAAEAARAVRVLAPSARLRLLHHRDGRLHDHREAMTNALVETIGTDGSSCLLVSNWLGDGHPDHAAASRAAAAAAWRTDAEHVEAPIWFWHWAEPDDLETLERAGRLLAAGLGPAALAAKRAAVAAYRSQTRPLGPEPGNETMLGRHILAHFERDFEIFCRTSADEPSPFEELHRGSADPWATRTSWYEARKRALTLAALPVPRFETALEIGCSVGALAEDLAERCDRVVAVDESAAALERARDALRGSGVEFRRCRVPEQWPWQEGVPGPELVVVSEIGYFLSPRRLLWLARRIADSGAGTVVACHWRHPIVGWPLDAARVHTLLDSVLGLPIVLEARAADFELFVWSRAGAESAEDAESPENAESAEGVGEC